MGAVATLTRELLVRNRAGIHARVGVLLAKQAKEFTSEIRFKKANYVADCRSVLDLLSLGAAQGDSLVVEVVGEDAAAALEAITALFDARFNEDEVE